MPRTQIAENRKARFEFELGDRLEAGLVLQGWEVKALRAGRAQIPGGYVLVRRAEAWVTGVNINPLPQAARWADSADRTRKLLLKKAEIARIDAFCSQQGHSCVPVQLYWKDQHIKMEIALSKGRKQYDKRRLLKDRDWERRKAKLRRGQASAMPD